MGRIEKSSPFFIQQNRKNFNLLIVFINFNCRM
jgi:hypothetical protein